MTRKSKRPIGTVVPGGEPKITVRVIGRCNFHCPSCSTGSHPGRQGVLRYDDFKRIIASLKKEDFRGVVNISGGEPTLHKRLEKMVQFAAANLSHSRIVVFTNGTWVGKPWWRHKLNNLLSRPNIIIRMSLDRQHTMGALKASGLTPSKENIKKFEKVNFRRGRNFMNACLASGAKPGINFDFAFKGKQQEAETYLAPMGRVPVYYITFQKNPETRPIKYGYFGVDIDAQGKPYVFPTLGHILRNEPLGSIEELPLALEMNRKFVRNIP